MKLIYLLVIGSKATLLDTKALFSWLDVNSVRLLIAAGFLILTVLLRRPMSHLIIRIFRRFRRENRLLWEQWESKLVKPTAGLISAAVVLALIYNLFPLATSTNVIHKLAQSYFSLAVFRLIYLSIDLFFDDINFLARKHGHKPDVTALSYIATTTKVLTFVIGALTILSHWIYNLSAIVAGVGIGGLIVALAAQDTAANVFASVAILLDKPFVIGDWISAEGISGGVEKIGLRSTHIRMADKSLVAMPNAKLGNATVTNMTERINRLVAYTIAVDPRTSSEKLQQLVSGIKDILDHTEGVELEGRIVVFDLLDDRQPGISIRFLTINDYEQMLKIKEAVNLAIIALLQKQEIALATTAVTVYTGGTEGEKTDLGTQGIQ